MPREASRLLCLPTELIAVILGELDVKSLLTCKLVCRSLNSIDGADLQYKIELARAGMRDGPPGRLTSTERLQMLTSHLEAWRTLSWTKQETIPILLGDIWELVDSVFGMTDSPRSMLLRQLPSQLRRVESREWKIEFKFDVEDFSIDPSQDLLLVIERHGMIHLLSLSTGEAHPSAALPMICGIERDEDIGAVPPGYSFSIRISSHLVGVLFIPTEGDLDLKVFDWNTGNSVMHMSSVDLRCFTFLPNDLIMVAFIWDQITPALAIYNLKSGPGRLDKLCAFHFPDVGENFTPIDLYISFDPAPSRTPCWTGEFPFSVSLEDQLFTITYVSIEENADEAVKALLFFPLSTILAHIVKARPGGLAWKRISWQDWGLNGTRFILSDDKMSEVWTCHTFGMKFVLPLQLSPTGYFQAVRVYDFNPLLAKQDTPMSTSALTASPSTIHMLEKLFAEPVHARLPCWYSDKVLPGDVEYEAVMMAEDALIAVTMGARNLTLLSF